MKICPKCNRTYDGDNVFCVEDGTTLIADASQSRVVVSWDDPPSGDEIPTQYVSIPQQPHVQQPAADGSRWLYALVGGLCAVIIVGGAYLIINGSRENKPEFARVENSLGPSTNNSNGASNYDPGNLGANKPFNPMNSAANLNARSGPTAPGGNTMPAINANYNPGKLERNFSRTFYGTVDDDGIEMDLRRNGSRLSGKVRPQNRSADISVEGYIENDGSFTMEEKSDIGLVTGLYRGRIQPDNTINGTWSKPDGDKTRPLSLRSQ